MIDRKHVAGSWGDASDGISCPASVASRVLYIFNNIIDPANSIMKSPEDLSAFIRESANQSYGLETSVRIYKNPRKPRHESTPLEIAVREYQKMKKLKNESTPEAPKLIILYKEFNHWGDKPRVQARLEYYDGSADVHKRILNLIKPNWGWSIKMVMGFNFKY